MYFKRKHFSNKYIFTYAIYVKCLINAMAYHDKSHKQNASLVGHKY